MASIPNTANKGDETYPSGALDTPSGKKSPATWDRFVPLLSVATSLAAALSMIALLHLHLRNGPRLPWSHWLVSYHTALLPVVLPFSFVLAVTLICHSALSRTLTARDITDRSSTNSTSCDFKKFLAGQVIEIHLQLLTDAIDRAGKLWEVEKKRLGTMPSRFVSHACVYHMLTTTALTLCACICLKCHAGSAWCTYRLASTSVVHGYAISVGSACLMSLMFESVRALRRVANRDINFRFFAYANWRLVNVIVDVVCLRALVPNSAFKELGPNLVSVFLGVFAVLVGGEIRKYVLRVGTTMLGLDRAVATDASDLETIQGIGREEALRLEEEGITTRHALAHATTPRIYYQTPYTLLAICDWQDQAMLHCVLGAEQASRWRSQLEVRGLIDAQSVAMRHIRVHENAVPSNATPRAEVLKFVMGAQDEALLDIQLRRLAENELGLRLLGYQRSAPDMSEVTAMTPNPPKEISCIGGSARMIPVCCRRLRGNKQRCGLGSMALKR